MPENEVTPQAENKEAGGSKEFMGGSRGWIILVVAEILTVVIFLVVMHYNSSAGYGEAKTPDQGEKPEIDLDDLNKYNLVLSDLSYAVPTQVGRSATLVMEIEIILGKTPEEMQDKNFTIEPTDWDKLKTALEAIKPDILDVLQKYVGQQTYAQLNSASGRENIQRRVKEFANEAMGRIKIKDMKDSILKNNNKRVTKVLITRFFMQQ